MLSRAMCAAYVLGWSTRAGRVLCTIFLIGMSFAACGEGAADRTVARGGAPVLGGTLVVASAIDLEHANPLITTEGVTHDVLRSLLYMTLVRHGRDNGYEPWLAESWELEGDTGIVFHIRRDVRWHDGLPTTAHDVEFTYRLAKAPETGYPNASLFERWGEVEVLDSFTVRFRFEPHPDPLVGWPDFPILPRHHLAETSPAALRQAGFNRSPVGNGPFRFVSVRSRDRWIFEANLDFPSALGGRPLLDRVVWRVIPESSAQINELLAGTVDLILAPSPAQLRDLSARPGWRAIVRPSRKYQFIGWNGLRPPLGDPKVRLALTLALNRGEILAALRGGYGELAVGPLYPGHWAFLDTLTPVPYDPAAARRLLAEAGWSDRDGDGVLEDDGGRELRITLSLPAENEYNRNVAEKIRSDLAEVGVRVAPRPLDFATLVADAVSPERRFEAVLLAWEADPRPTSLRDLFHSSAIGGPFQLASYRNAEVDRLLDEASRARTPESALPPLHGVQRILREEQPWTFLFYTPDLYIVSERVQGIEMDVQSAFQSLPHWWKTSGSPDWIARNDG